MRAENLLAALKSNDLITVEVPHTIPSEIMAITHDREMVAYLHNLSIRSQEIIHNDFAVYNLTHQLTGDDYYYESMFPAQMMGSAHITARTAYIFDNTSPVGRGTWDAALGAASAAYAGADVLLNSETCAYALCRPPGHHAGRRMMGGYCYLNNAAIAANHLKSKGKVAILDIDYHHGNGTQDIFRDDPSVLFVSIHADPAVDYPYYTGFVEENHTTNLNIPLPHGTTSTTYLAALSTAIDAIQQFAPASLVVSLGFDIYRHDPMGHFTLDVPDFAAIGERIAAIGLPTLYVQEGGYNLDALGDMAVTFFRTVKDHQDATSTHSIV
jgi:acetoin utilization deacetylase AcuC-like enzyme